MISKKIALLLMLSLGSGVILLGEETDLHKAVLAGDEAVTKVEKALNAKKTGFFKGDVCDKDFFQVKDAQGKTALYLAVEKGLHQIVILLLNKEKALNDEIGFAINMLVEKDNSNQTPIDAAIALSDEGTRDAILHQIKKHIEDQQSKSYSAFSEAKVKVFLDKINAVLNPAPAPASSPAPASASKVVPAPSAPVSKSNSPSLSKRKLSDSTETSLPKDSEKAKSDEKKEVKEKEKVVVVDDKKVVDQANQNPAPAPAPTPAPNPDPADPTNGKSKDEDNAPKPDAAPMSMETKVMIGGAVITVSALAYLCYEVYSDFEELEIKNQEVKEEEQLSTSELITLAMQKTWKRCASYFAI